jgi:hypothetical protein
VSVAVTALLIRFGVGLRPMLPKRPADEEAPPASRAGSAAISRAASRASAALASMRSESRSSRGRRALVHTKSGRCAAGGRGVAGSRR